MNSSSGDSRTTAVAGAPSVAEGQSRCRFCGAGLRDVFVDLGAQPLANAYLTEADLRRPEPFYPLRLLVCAACFLVQA